MSLCNKKQHAIQTTEETENNRPRSKMKNKKTLKAKAVQTLTTRENTVPKTVRKIN